MFYKKEETITLPISNNAFSFVEREIVLKRKPSITVPSQKKGTWQDVRLGSKVVFEEIDENRLLSCTGLEHFIYSMEDGELPSYAIMDNHNHAFYYWMKAYGMGIVPWGLPLVHVDQHKDMRVPSEGIAKQACGDLNTVAEYTNTILNVGNFIRPALDNGFITEVMMVDNSTALEQDLPQTPFILDIDLDIFFEDLAYLDFERVLGFIHDAMKQAAFVTVATSPFFFSGNEAMKWLSRVFDLSQ